MKRKNGKEWVCKAGCPPKKLCKHLEALLPSVEGPGKGRLVYSPHIELKETAVTPLDEYLKYEAATLTQVDEPDDRLVSDETAMRTRLAKLGLPMRKVNVVVDRLVHGLTFREIAQDRSYSSATAAHTAYTDAMAFLKPRLPQPKTRGNK